MGVGGVEGGTRERGGAGCVCGKLGWKDVLHRMRGLPMLVVFWNKEAHAGEGCLGEWDTHLLFKM